MKTGTMEKRLNELAGKLEPGKLYSIMPSDCSGNGYDIAMQSRPDESGNYMINGMLCRVTCRIRVGSRKWSKGIPAGYTLSVNPKRPYVCKRGEHAEIIHRKGNNIGNSYMSRVLASIAIIRPDGGKVYRGHTPYWIESTNTYALHYKSGLNKADNAAFNSEIEQLKEVVNQINATPGNF